MDARVRTASNTDVIVMGLAVFDSQARIGALQ